MRKIVSLIAAGLGIALAASGCGAVSTYAAKVNGVAITQHQLDNELEAIKANKKYLASIEQQLQQQGQRAVGSGKDTFDTGFVARVLTRRILLQIIHQGLVKRHVKITDTQRTTALNELKQSFGADVAILNSFSKSYRAELVERNAEVSALQNALATTKINDATIQHFYDTNKARFTQTCARHILAQLPQDHPPTAAEDAAAKAKADGWKARLDKGEDFATIAKAESDDKGSGAQGGDLGCQAKGALVPEFEAGEDSLQINQISAPVKSSFGYHVIQVTGRKVQTVKEAEPTIRQQLQQADGNVINDFLDKALAKAKIAVNPRYGHFDKKAQTPGVVPPSLPATTTTTSPDLPGSSPGLGTAPTGDQSGQTGQPGQAPPSDTPPPGG